MLDPLDHLLSRNEHAVALGELLLQAIEREMIVVPRQQDMHGEAEPQRALRNQARRQGRDRDARLATAACVLGPHDPSPDQFGRNEIGFLGDRFADPPQRLPAARTRRGLGLQRDRLGLDRDRQPVAGPAPSRVPAPLVGEHLVADGPGAFHRLDDIVLESAHLGFLLRRRYQ